MAMLEEEMDRLIESRLTGGISRLKYETKKTEIEIHLMMARIRYADVDAEKVNLAAEFLPGAVVPYGAGRVLADGFNAGKVNILLFIF